MCKRALPLYREEEYKVLEGLQDPIQFIATPGTSSLNHLKRKELPAWGCTGKCCWEAKSYHPGPPAQSPEGGSVGSALHGQHPPPWHSLALCGVGGEGMGKCDTSILGNLPKPLLGPN